MSFEPITSQEKLDEIIKERLDREKKKYDGYLSKDDVTTVSYTHLTLPTILLV